MTIARRRTEITKRYLEHLSIHGLAALASGRSLMTAGQALHTPALDLVKLLMEKFPDGLHPWAKTLPEGRS